MENNELDCLQDSEGLDSEKIRIGMGIFGFVFGVFMGIKAWRADKALKKEREKNLQRDLQYQHIARKHQAVIDALKNDREREAYKNRIWETLKAETEE